MTTNLIPPLTIYYYSPYSMEKTAINNGKRNNSFFNEYQSIYGTSTAILLNEPQTKFSNAVICSTCNKFATLYLTNTNNILSNPIGNFSAKQSYLKLQQSSILYCHVGILIHYIYDSNGFNYGTIIVNIKNNNFVNSFDSNGSLSDCNVNLKIIFADGYYNYLNTPFVPNIQNSINVNILNGIRTLTIPSDPSGLYVPVFINDIAKYDIATFYYPPLQSTFESQDLQMEEYFLDTKLYLDKALTFPYGQLNILSDINKSPINFNVYDGLFFQLFSLNNISPVVSNGNILGLTFANKYQTGSIGYTSVSGTIYPTLVLYADRDYDYLNYLMFLYKKAPIIITEINPDTTRTIYVPPKPLNFSTPPIIYPNNVVTDTGIIYNKFYILSGNNSITFDVSQEHQNITLFSKIYDSYDPLTGNFGNQIGTWICYKFILNQNNQVYVGTLGYISFLNGQFISNSYVVVNKLDKIGALIPETNIKTCVTSASDDYGYSASFVYYTKFDGYAYCEVGYL